MMAGISWQPVVVLRLMIAMPQTPSGRQCCTSNVTPSLKPTLNTVQTPEEVAVAVKEALEGRVRRDAYQPQELSVQDGQVDLQGGQLQDCSAGEEEITRQQ